MIRGKGALRRRFLHGAMLAASAVLAGGTALAQSNESVTVVAPHMLVHKAVGQTYVGVPIEQVSLSRQVGFSDLDLTKQAGAVALKQRVSASAQESCAQLARLYPDDIDAPLPTNKSCEKDAVEAAMPQVEAAIEEAKR